VCSEAHGGAGYTFGVLTILLALPPGRKTQSQPELNKLSQKSTASGRASSNQ